MKKIPTVIVPAAIAADSAKPKRTDHAPVAKRHQRHLPIARRYWRGRPSGLPSSEIAAQRPRRVLPPDEASSAPTAEQSHTQLLTPDKQSSPRAQTSSSNSVQASAWTYRLQDARLAREMDRDGSPEPPLSQQYLFGCALVLVLSFIILLSVL